MAKLLVIYPKPADPAAFDAHYRDVHVPLAKKLPGLTKYEVSSGKVSGGAHLVATLHFPSLDAMKAALGGAEGKATADDLKNLQPAQGQIQMLMFDDSAV